MKGRPTKWPDKYGISLKGYERLLAEQDGLCAICFGPPDDNRKLSIDHCHETGKVRGLLCTRCNMGLGYFRDAPNVLESAIGYLARFEGLNLTP